MQYICMCFAILCLSKTKIPARAGICIPKRNFFMIFPAVCMYPIQLSLPPPKTKIPASWYWHAQNTRFHNIRCTTYVSNHAIFGHPCTSVILSHTHNMRNLPIILSIPPLLNIKVYVWYMDSLDTISCGSNGCCCRLIYYNYEPSRAPPRGSWSQLPIWQTYRSHYPFPRIQSQCLRLIHE